LSLGLGILDDGQAAAVTLYGIEECLEDRRTIVERAAVRFVHDVLHLSGGGFAAGVALQIGRYLNAARRQNSHGDTREPSDTRTPVHI
jgi:hypothetical protein